MTREDGFYWVKIGRDWQIGEWDSGVEWFMLNGTDIPATVNDAGWGIAVERVHEERILPPFAKD